jgi:hypothetical protein
MTDLNVDKLTPPPELVEQWMREASDQPPGPDARVIATQAARWGADQELEACCEWANATGWEGAGDSLRAARRPKPPSLKEQALEMLECIPTHDNSGRENGIDLSVIRRALEALPND